MNDPCWSIGSPIYSNIQKLWYCFNNGNFPDFVALNGSFNFQADYSGLVQAKPLTSVQSNLVNGRIAVLSPLAAANGFVQSWLPFNGSLRLYVSQPPKRHTDRQFRAHSCAQHTDHATCDIRSKWNWRTQNSTIEEGGGGLKSNTTGFLKAVLTAYKYVIPV